MSTVMTDVPPVFRSQGPADSSSPQKKINPEKFQEEMTKISKTDPEQKKKKQQQAAASAQKKAEKVTVQAAPQKTNVASPSLSFPKGGNKGEKIASQSAVPREQIGSNTPVQKHAVIEKVGEAEKRQKREKKRSEETAPEEAIEETPLVAAPVEKKFDVQVSPSSEKKGGETLSSSSASEEIPQPLSSLPEQPSSPFEEAAVETFSPSVASTPPSKKEEAKFLSPPPTPPTPDFAPSFLSTQAPSASSYTFLKPEILALFEKMVGVILVMQQSGDTTTTIHLNSLGNFTSSLFEGGQIVITQSSTALNQFNIELKGDAQLIALFEQNIPALQQAFQTGRHSFKVQNIYTSLLHTKTAPRKDRVERKQESSGDASP